MRILYYSPHPGLNLQSHAGYATHMREMIQAFRELGHEVRPLIMGGESLAPGADAPAPGWKQAAKRLVPPPAWETLKDLQLLRFDRFARQQLAQALRDFRPDLVYERGNYLQTSGVEAASEAGIFHALEMNSPYIEERVYMQGRSWLMGEARRRERQQAEGTGLLITVSTALEAYYRQAHGLPAGKCLVTPNSIRPEDFRPDPVRQAAIAERLGLRGRTVIGFVGSIFPHHGVDLLIGALAAVAAEFPEALLLIVGDGEIRPQLEAMAASQVPGRVIFAGKVPHREVAQYIALMDIAAIASTKWYMSPIKIFEYGAMGKAIIAPRVGPVLDVMTPGEDGLLVEPGEAAVSEALRALLRSPELRQRTGRSFQEKVLARHTWRRTAERILAQAGSA
jgi:glycosyltransferase involved in cell wall biosynthesis